MTTPNGHGPGAQGPDGHRPTGARSQGSSTSGTRNGGGVGTPNGGGAPATLTGGRGGGAPAVLSSQTNAASRPTGARFGPAAMFGGPAAKSLDFKGSSKRLLRMLLPHKAIVATLLLLGAISVTLTVLGPKILGHATDLIFAGVFGQILANRFPPGTT